MENRREYLDRFRRENADRIEDAAARMKEELGIAPEKIDRIVSEKEQIGALLDGLSEKDFTRLRQVMDDPQILDKVLSSKKARENLSRILGELDG